MKRFTLILIVLLVALMVFNFTQVDYADLDWRKNRVTYMNLVGNILMLVSLVLTNLRFARESR